MTRSSSPRRIGARVKIVRGMPEFVGKIGTIIDCEMDGRTRMYRVKFDEPIMVEGVGLVSDDIWASVYLVSIW